MSSYSCQRMYIHICDEVKTLSIKPHSENISKQVHLENLSLLFFPLEFPWKLDRKLIKKEEDKE